MSFFVVAKAVRIGSAMHLAKGKGGLPKNRGMHRDLQLYRFGLKPGESLTIGRNTGRKADPVNDVGVHNQTVSRNQWTVRRMRDGSYRVTAKACVNPTFQNGQMVAGEREHVAFIVRQGDVVTGGSRSKAPIHLVFDPEEKLTHLSNPQVMRKHLESLGHTV